MMNYKSFCRRPQLASLQAIRRPRASRAILSLVSPACVLACSVCAPLALHDMMCMQLPKTLMSCSMCYIKLTGSNTYMQ